MKRKLASIQKIIAIHPIANADAIECADILGWHLVVKKNDFKPGNLCVFFEIDSLLPIKPIYEFLRKSCFNQRLQGFRIKTMTMRGQISQGLALPLNTEMLMELPSPYVYEDMDVTEFLGIRKYEPEVPIELFGEAVGKIPSQIPSTDEIRIETIPQILERYGNIDFYVSEKLDGTSSTYFILNDEFGFCGRQWQFSSNNKNVFWKIAQEQEIEIKLRSLKINLAIQGEIIGPKIQGNPYKLPTNQLFIYNIFDIDNHHYLDFSDFMTICNSLGFRSVPILANNFKLPQTIDEMKKFATGTSTLFNTKREGIVCRPLNEINDYEIGRLSFKVISPQYLLEEKDEK